MVTSRSMILKGDRSTSEMRLYLREPWFIFLCHTEKTIVLLSVHAKPILIYQQALVSRIAKIQLLSTLYDDQCFLKCLYFVLLACDNHDLSSLPLMVPFFLSLTLSAHIMIVNLLYSYVGI